MKEITREMVRSEALEMAIRCHLKDDIPTNAETIMEDAQKFMDFLCNAKINAKSAEAYVSGKPFCVGDIVFINGISIEIQSKEELALIKKIWINQTEKE